MSNKRAPLDKDVPLDEWMELVTECRMQTKRSDRCCMV